MNESKADCPFCEPRDLAAGEFYGAVSEKREIAGFVLSEIHHAGERRLPTHSHQAAYFSLLIDGNYAETYGSRSFEYRPFTVWWHKPGIVHRDVVGPHGGRFFNVELSPECHDLLAEAAPARADFAEHGTPLVWLACRLFQELSHWRACSPLAAESLSLEMAAYASEGRIATASPATPWLKRVADCLNDEPQRRHSTAALAKLAGVHPVHLAAVFRRTFGLTIADYLRRARVRAAADLLRGRDFAIADIAAEFGFADQSHFTRSFRRVVGISPGAFREAFAARAERPYSQ